MSDFSLLIESSLKKFSTVIPDINILQFIIVIPSLQKLLLIDKKSVKFTYDISTSKYGLGNINNSYKTPIGLHYIAEKIGHNMPIFTIFKGREPLENNLTLEQFMKDENLEIRHHHFDKHDDVITTRILWLKGYEAGINLGGNVDTYNRYIYIHGTAHEDHIGKKSSHGCIRMKNQDILELFKHSQINMPVIIMDS